MKKLGTLKDALAYELAGLYDSEKKLQHYLSRYRKLTTSSSLKKVVTFYQEYSEKRINKLKWVFQYLNQKVSKRVDQGVKALLKEYDEILRNTEAGELRDAILAACIERILHLKISTYRTCQSFACELRIHNAEEILKEILTHEKEVNQRLSNLAMKEINNAHLTEIKMSVA